MKSMVKSLQKSTTIFLLTVFTLVAIGATSFIRVTLLSELNDLEDKYVKEHIGRVEKNIQYKLNQLQQIAQDYAAWDDSYHYISEHYPEYETVNLPLTTFENLDLDMMVYIHHEGHYVFAKGMDENQKKLVPIYKDLKKNLEKCGLLTNTDLGMKVKGLILLDEGPMLIASHPIITSEYTGPVRGNLIVGRFLNQREVDEIGEDLNLTLSVKRMNGEHGAVFSQLTSSEPIMVDSTSKNTVRAYSLLNDLFKQPIGGLLVTLDREFSAAARDKLNAMMMYLPIFPTTLMVLISTFFSRRVLQRLKKMSSDVANIGEPRDGAIFLPNDHHNDEISVVSDAINGMLRKLGAIQEELKASKEKYRKLVEAGRDVIITVDLHGFTTYISPNCDEITGHPDHEIIGEPITFILHSESLESWKLILRQAGEGCTDFDIYEFLGKAANGTWQWFRMDISVINHEDQSTALMGVFYNIHEKKLAEFALLEAHAGLEAKVSLRTRQLVEANSNLSKEISLRKMALEKIEHLAYFDALTGLPNRVLLVSRIQQAIDLAKQIEKPIGILFLDLDGFKTVNDTLGHCHGDELLKKVGARLLNQVRESDTVARMGGDEFVIMVQNLESAEHIHRVSNKICEAFRDPFILKDNEVFVTASIGMSVYPLDGVNHETLIKNADLAMYKAKEKGKNQSVLCTATMKELIHDNMKLSNGLYRALERNELEVYYQPKISL